MIIIFRYIKNGKVFFKNANFPAALDSFEAALKLDPKNKKILYHLGFTFLKMDNLKSALKSFEQCLQLDANFAKALAKKGIVHWKLMQYHSALDCFKRGLKLDPSNLDCKDGVNGINEYFARKDTLADEKTNEVRKNVSQDPEVQNILKDESIMSVVRKIEQSKSGEEKYKYIRDEKINMAVVKLFQAGYLDWTNEEKPPGKK